MGAYHYQALTQSGQRKKGIIEADSERHARQLLREKALLPTQLKAASKHTNRHKKNKLASTELTLITRQLATLIAASIPIEEAVRGVGAQIEKFKTRELLMGVRTKILEGFGLAQAMGEFPQAFPELYRATIHAGEQTGRLDKVLEKLADYTENQQKIKKKVQHALIYPSLMVFISGSIVSFLLAFVVPTIIEVFSNTQQSLPLLTQILISLSDFTKTYGLTCLILLSVCFLSLKKILMNPKARFVWDNMLLKLPLISYVIKSASTARYIHTFSILFNSGVNVLETMQVSTCLITNLVINKALERARLRVKEGGPIHEALKETGFISPMTSYLIASGEKSGELASMMERAALHLDEELKHYIDTGLTLLEPLIILLMGAVVLFIVLATLLPIFSMEQLVT